MTAEKKPPVVEEVGAYYPGMVVASKEQADSKQGGISSFDNKTGKTSPPPKSS